MKFLAPLFLILVPGLAWSQEVLRVYNWTEYIDPAVVKSFESEYGVVVDYHEFETAAELNAGLDDAKPYDVVVPSHYMLAQMIENKKLQPIDTQRLENYSKLGMWSTQVLATQAGQHYAVPYLWGTIGLAINQRLAQPVYGGVVPNSWHVIFDDASRARLAGCGVGLQDSPEEILSIWFNYQGRRLQGASAAIIERNIEKLRPLVADARAINNEGLDSELAEGKLCAALVWSGEALLAMQENPNVIYDVPEEGSIGFIDTLAIPANARNPELAHRFIDHLLKPENMLRNSAEAMYYNFLVDDAPELKAFAQEHPSLVVTADQRRRTYFKDGLSGLQQPVLDAAWTSMRTAQQ